MNSLGNMTISVPARLLEVGLSKAELQELARRWLVISLFQQGKLAADEASRLLATTPGGFFELLDQQGVLYDLADEEQEVTRRSPVLEEQARLQERLDTVTEELLAAQYDLAQVKKQLEEADRIKSEFIATVSHELRTPLNSIIGFAKLLLNQKLGPLNEIQHTDLSVIYSSAQHLLSLVNDILDLSKIEAGKMRLDRTWLTVEEIIVGVVASTYILIEDKPIELKEEIEPDLPPLYVDRGRIRQVALNLLSNSAKFTDSGNIIMRIRRLTRNNREFVCFSVRDTGIGIAPEDKDKVFEAFRQIDSSVGRRAEGTGLGMPISRRLIELHGGELWFESQLDRGSTFYFTIPVEPPNTLETAGATQAESD